MPTHLLEKMRNAARAADTEKLKEYAYEIERRQLGSDSFNDGSLKAILTLLSDPDVLALHDAGSVLAPLEFDADKLTPDRKSVV